MKYTLFAACFIFGSTLFGQNIWRNPSFEGVPKDAKMPAHWRGCSPGSTPDILPGFWGVELEASDKTSYVGLITREDGSWEAIGQKVKTLNPSSCYGFSIDLAHSKQYSGYNLPVRLRIWGGTKDCDKDQLLGDSGIVTNEDWKTYDFSFEAKKDINFIIIEAYYVKGMAFDYRGNILVDNISPITKCDRAFLIRTTPSSFLSKS